MKMELVCVWLTNVQNHDVHISWQYGHCGQSFVTKWTPWSSVGSRLWGFVLLNILYCNIFLIQSVAQVCGMFLPTSINPEGNTEILKLQISQLSPRAIIIWKCYWDFLFLFIKPARCVGFWLIKKIPYQAPLINWGPKMYILEKCSLGNHIFLMFLTKIWDPENFTFASENGQKSLGEK